MSKVWYAYDGLGSVLGEIDGDAGSPTFGDLKKSRVYDAYGNVRAEDAAYSTSGHRFVGGLGHPSEGETGLIYMRARYMDPAVGRFISEDPAGSGNNWFVYCNDDPVNLVDLSGKSPLLGLWVGITLGVAGTLGGYSGYINAYNDCVEAAGYSGLIPSRGLSDRDVKEGLMLSALAGGATGIFLGFEGGPGTVGAVGFLATIAFSVCYLLGEHFGQIDANEDMNAYDINR